DSELLAIAFVDLEIVLTSRFRCSGGNLGLVDACLFGDVSQLNRAAVFYRLPDGVCGFVEEEFVGHGGKKSRRDPRTRFLVAPEGPGRVAGGVSRRKRVTNLPLKPRRGDIGQRSRESMSPLRGLARCRATLPGAYAARLHDAAASRLGRFQLVIPAQAGI